MVRPPRRRPMARSTGAPGYPELTAPGRQRTRTRHHTASAALYGHSWARRQWLPIRPADGETTLSGHSRPSDRWRRGWLLDAADVAIAPGTVGGRAPPSPPQSGAGPVQAAH